MKMAQSKKEQWEKTLKELGLISADDVTEEHTQGDLWTFASQVRGNYFFTKEKFVFAGGFGLENFSVAYGDISGVKTCNASEDKAVILYYAWVSDPHVTVWREELSYTVQDGKFQVTSQQLQFLDGICIADEFYAAYPDGVINGTMLDYYAYNEAGETLNSNAKNPDMALSGYAGLDQPDTAAINLLNILKNENKVTVNVEYTNAQETQAVVTFAFLEDASTAKVRMIKPYGEDSIWLPQTY